MQSENSKEKKYKLTTNQLEGVIAKSLVDQEKQLKTALTPLLPLWPQNWFPFPTFSATLI